ncbi:hypothetical protein ACFLZN_02265 [Nanoarchaeota archaeon]
MELRNNDTDLSYRNSAWQFDHLAKQILLPESYRPFSNQLLNPDDH